MSSNSRNEGYNIITDGQNVLDHPVKNNLTTYDSICKIATGRGDEYTSGCLLSYNYFKHYYKMIAIDLIKQQALHADSKAMKKLILQEI